MKSILRTDKGRVRAVNEDAAYADDTLGVLCDGMGGHRAGDVAATLVVSMLSRGLRSKTPSVRTLSGAVARANEQVHNMSTANPACAGMGTTLTLLWADVDSVILAQVGDSRAYLLRGGVLRQCTHDHSMVAELVAIGAITAEQARTHPYRNMVTRSVGTEPRVDVDIFELGRHPGDRWLLCSDGLTGLVTDHEIEMVLTREGLEAAAGVLVSLALERGGHDNITVVLMEDEAGDPA